MENFYSRRLLNRAEVAKFLGRSESWFRAKYKELHSQGFPEPVSGCGNKWDPKAISHWLDQQLNHLIGHNDNYLPSINSWEDELIERVKML